MKKLVLIIMSLFLILLVGCYKTGQAGLVPGRDICTSNRDCESGRICVNYSCVPRPCMKDRDCGTGMKCVNGRCVTKPCTKDAECESGSICDNGRCVTGCRTNADCKRGIICLLLGRCNMKCENGRCEEFPRELPNPPQKIPPPRNAPPSVCVLDMVLCADGRTYVARCPPDCRPCPCPGIYIPQPDPPRIIAPGRVVVPYWDGTRFLEITVTTNRDGQLVQVTSLPTRTGGPLPGPTQTGGPPTGPTKIPVPSPS